jgi:hypothetical protein
LHGLLGNLLYGVEGKLIDPDSVQIEIAFDFKAFDLTSQSDIDRARRIFELLQSETLVRTRFVDARLENSAGEILDNERIWLDVQRQLGVNELTPGGPYTKDVPVEDCFVILNQGRPDAERVKLSHLKIRYDVKGHRPTIWSIYGDQVVDLILMDFETGEHEYVQLQVPDAQRHTSP